MPTVASSTAAPAGAHAPYTRLIRLGLCLVRTLVRQLNGEMSIDADNGLAFTIAFTESS